MAAIWAASFSHLSHAQESEPYTQANAFGVFGEYSNDSSHIYLGQSRQRKLASLGASYTRRLFRTEKGELRFLVEWRPAFEESDPITSIKYSDYSLRYDWYNGFIQTVSPSKCTPGSSSEALKIYLPGGGTFSYTYRQTTTCYREWTYAQGFAPLGFQYAFRRHHQLRPFLTGNAGTLFSTRPIPMADAGSFNFMFAFGVGVEFYRQDHESVALEYRVNHISNKFTAPENPGIDSGLFRVVYSFGR